MKALVKRTWFILTILLITLGCAKKEGVEKEMVVIKKIMIGDDFSATERPWGISDGIKIISGDKTEYFVFDIESPPDAIRNKAEVRFIYRLDLLDSTVHEKELTYSIDSLYPFYTLNSLDVFNVNNQYGAYFYTSLLGYPYGIDPYELIMWVYYNEKLYKLSGIIPVHQDWSWEKTYSFTPDERLKNEYPKVYQKIIDTWNQNIDRYKKYYDEH